MSVITAKGNQAKENAQKSNLDLKKIMLRLKENQSHKVRLLGVEDYVEYNSAGDYNIGIYNQPVTMDSPLLVAHKKGGEKFKNLYKKSRYVFIFASLETGELVAWDASKTQAKALISTIEEYADVIEEIAFNFKRTGDKTETVYSLNPIIKMKPEDKEKFEAFNDKNVEADFYEAILQPKDEKFLAKLLKEAGFDVETHLPHIDLSDDANASAEESNNEDAEPITESDDDENILDHI
jgi:hypothetical protein